MKTDEIPPWEAAYQCPHCKRASDLPYLVCNRCGRYVRLLTPNARMRVWRYGLIRRALAWACGYGWGASTRVEVEPLKGPPCP